MYHRNYQNLLIGRKEWQKKNSLKELELCQLPSLASAWNKPLSLKLLLVDNLKISEEENE